MNDAESALLGERDGHVRFGNGVHGGADDGNIQADVAGELRLRVGLAGNDIGTGGQQQNVVKSEGFRDGKMNHKCLGIPQRCG